MYSYNARFYDPKAARFLTMDPVREHANPYAYVAWNPVAYVDPTGMVLGFSGVGEGLNQGLFWGSWWNAWPTWYTAKIRQSGYLGGGSMHPYVASARASLAGDETSLAAGIQRQVEAANPEAQLSWQQAGQLAKLILSYGAKMLKADVLDVLGGVVGYARGVRDGLMGIGKGLATLDAESLGKGIANLLALAVPRLASHGGLLHPAEVRSTPVSDSRPNVASFNHDDNLDKLIDLHGSSAWLNSTVHAQWIVDAWTTERGIEPGPVGQAYRIVGTVGFGLVVLALWAAGR